MNEDRLVGAGREMLGQGEQAAGGIIGSDRLQADGMVDQVSGAIQHGYGEVKDVVGDALAEGRRLLVRTDDALRDRLGENRHFYVLAGAIALLAVAVLYAGREG